MANMKYMLIGFGLIINGTTVMAVSNETVSEIAEISEVDFNELATDAFRDKKRLMVIFHNGNCKACDDLVDSNKVEILNKDYQLYKMNVTTGFEITCPDGESLNENEFLENKGIISLPAVVITDEQGNVKVVENAITNSQKIMEVGRKYKLRNSNSKSSQIPVDRIPWVTLPNGRQISPVYGNMKTGHHVTFIKFTPGLRTQPHIHSNDYVGVVVKGEMRQYEQGKPETELLLRSGSIWSIPGNIAHISECSSKEECIFIIHQDHFFDRKIVNNE